MNPDAASDIAIAGLQYIAGNSEELSRFVALTGVAPDDIRAIAGTPDFMVAVLDYFLGNEPTLLAFVAQAGLDAGDIRKARMAIVPEGQDPGW